MKKVISFSILLVSFCFSNILDEANKAYDEGNYKQASELDEKACNEGDIQGCGALGDLYYYGYGVKKDYKKAGEFYEKACNGGSIRDCDSLAYMYEHGMGGIEKDHKKAIELYEQACNGGKKDSCEIYEKLK